VRDSLRQSSEFKRVYEQGSRYDSSLITAFVLRNDQGKHRLGITVSRKTAIRALDRNRAKRLLRETFRLQKPLIEQLVGQYDWVLNGKRALLVTGLTDSMRDLERVINRVARNERDFSQLEAGENSSNSTS